MATQMTWRVLHVTDSHLYADPSASLLGLNTQDSFDQVITTIRAAQPAIDLTVATGDIAQDGSLPAYERFSAAMQSLNSPWLWTPGNHDNLSDMQQLSDHKTAGQGHFRLGNWLIIVLNTQVPGEVHGELSAAELERLQVLLQSQVDDQALQHTLIFMHHNPVPGSAGWMKDIDLHNADQLRSVIAPYDSVRALIYGHIHQSLDFDLNGVRHMCTPSTCIQFKPDVEDFTLDMQAPAWRWLTLHRSGRLDTDVVRLRDYKIIVDHTAGGY